MTLDVCYICESEKEMVKMHSTQIFLYEKKGRKFMNILVCDNCMISLKKLKDLLENLERQELSAWSNLYWELKTYVINELRKGNYEILYTL